jgi:hemerythrin superfamily protein
MTITLEQVQEFYSELLDENGTEEQLLEQRVRLTKASTHRLIQV